jgi:hypothetical protein
VSGWHLLILQAAGGIVGFDSQLVGAILAGLMGLFAVLFLAWASWTSVSLIRLLVLAARFEPILEAFEYDIGPILKKHPGHHSLTGDEQSILDRFQQKRNIPAEEVEQLRQAADREKNDESNPPDYRMGMAILQGTLRGELRARHGNWFRKFIWNFDP